MEKSSRKMQRNNKESIKTGFVSDSYQRIPKGQEGILAWRDALVSGNGITGLLENFDPQEDVIIYQNTKLVLDTAKIYDMPDYSGILDKERRNAVMRENIGIWTEAAEVSYKEKYGVENYVSGDVRPYHPAARMRIKRINTVRVENYRRYTNYRTGEIGGRWKDQEGKEWNTDSFPSRVNQLVITRMNAPEGSRLDVEISMDNILEMPVEQETMSEYDIPEAPVTVELAEAGEEIWICQCGKYGRFPVGLADHGRLCEFHGGGWATAVRIFTDGKVWTEERVRDIGSRVKILRITQASLIVMTAGIDRRTEGLEDIDDVRKILLFGMKEEIRRKTMPYMIKGMFDYKTALEDHRRFHEKAFGRVSLELCSSEEEREDRFLTNEELMKKQRQTGKMNKAYVERLFSQGRFALLCCSGYHAPRLCGMWTGCFMPLFHGGFISNANLNLQMSSAVIGNLPEAAQGYIQFVMRQLPDWERNAECIYGMEHALKAPVHTAGDGNGFAYHSLPGYPHAYSNGITDWMILPIFEYYQCFGNQKVPVGEDLQPERLKDVCEYRDQDIRRIQSEGFDLLEDILVPLIRGLMSFWMQYVDERFYMEENKELHLNDGTVISDYEKNGVQPYYLLSPGFSAENAPGGDGYNDVPALAANTAMDIAAIKNSLEMALTVTKDAQGFPWNPEWDILKRRIPPYLYTAEGALKEWALDFLEENDNHRHVSHGYAAWPAHEFRKSARLWKGIRIAMENRTRWNRDDDAMAHGHLHKALIAARLNNVTAFEEELRRLTLGEYQYTSLMTSHDQGRSSAYCTDAAIAYPGLLLEALVYSNEDEIEILPALPDEWTWGKLNGSMARCRAMMISLVWNRRKEPTERIMEEPLIRAEILPGTDRVIRLSAGIPWKCCIINGKEASVHYETEAEPYVRWRMDAGKKSVIEFY